jgi:CPA1 family monovalent cation:H+ antiporter
MSSDTRVLGSGVWQMVIFTINGLVFILIGLQLPDILDGLAARWTPGELIGLGAVVSALVIGVRLAWVYPATYLPRLLVRGLARRDPAPSPRVVLIIGWAGMRGVVSLGAALALPSSTPFRDLLLFLSFAVILATLVGQGLTLPWLIRRLGIGDDGSTEHDELHAREAAVNAALERLDALAGEWPGHLELIDRLRAQHEHAQEHLEHDHDEPGELPPDQERIEHTAIRQAVIDAQRLAIIDLRDRGIIGEEAVRRVERDLDLEELRGEG